MKGTKFVQEVEKNAKEITDVMEGDTQDLLEDILIKYLRKLMFT